MGTILRVLLFVFLTGQTKAQINLIGLDKIQASPKGTTYEKSFYKPVNAPQVEIFVQNGSGEDLFAKNCSGTLFQNLLCKIENLAKQITVKLDRPQEVSVSLNGQILISTSTNLPREKGSFKVTANLLTQNTLNVFIKGLPTSSIKIQVKSFGALNQPPIARIFWQGENGVAPETIQFSGITSSDPDGDSLVSYEWAFGNGETATGSMVSHTYFSGGNYLVTLTVTDNRGATGVVTQNLTLVSNFAPTSRIRTLSSNEGTAPFVAWLDASLSSDPDSQDLTYLWDFGDGTTSTTIKPVHEYSVPGSYTVTLTVNDPYLLSSSSTQTILVNALELPPDPATRAPALAEESEATTQQLYGFLFQGPNPIQINATPEAFEEERLLAVSGRVLNDNNEPLSAVKVQFIGHPEYGHTYTRADGKWDLAFNSGGLMILSFYKKGYTSSSRKIDSKFRVAQNIDDVLLTRKDENVTVVNLQNNPNGLMHTSSEQTDSSGPRKSVVFIPPNTNALVVRDDGSTVLVDQLSLRITEFTVGDDGPKKMPAPLPARTAYTWAADFSADEAEALGSERINFSSPLPIYVDNFLNIPVGTAVPVGYLNPKTGHWETLKDGIVVRVLNIENGTAQVDLGQGVAATSEQLMRHNFTTAELRNVGNVYGVGSTFWRATLTHFSTVDLNFNFAGNREPNPPNPDQKKQPCKCNGRPGCNCKIGSIVNVFNQSLIEKIPLPGTGTELIWSSNRSEGRLSPGEIEWQMFDDNMINSYSGRMLGANARLEVSGKSHSQYFSNPQSSDLFQYVWDGNDNYGRRVFESQRALLTAEYYYPYNYYLRQWDGGRDSTFDTFSPDTTVISMPSRGYFTVRKKYEVILTSPFDQFRKLSQKQFGGWSMNIHHTYDPLAKTLYKGDGAEQSVSLIVPRIQTYAGDGVLGNGPDNVLATQSSLNYPREMTQDSRGDYYITEPAGSRIRKIDRNTGLITTVVGTGIHGHSGDGGLATQARIGSPVGAQIAEDGTLYFGDYDFHVIRKVTPDGMITTIAGQPGVGGYSGTGGPAAQATIQTPRALVLGNDGYLYLSEELNHVIRRIGPDGIITLFAGTPQTAGLSGDGGLATQALFNAPNYTDMDSQGNMYIADGSNCRIRKISNTGYIETIAGTTCGYSGDNGPAINARMSGVVDVKVTQDGEVIVVNHLRNVIRIIGTDGIIRNFAGTGNASFNGDGRGPFDTDLNGPRAVFIDRDKNIFMIDRFNHRIRKYANSGPSRLSDTSYYIPAVDGSEIYVFNSNNLHVQTLYGDTWFVKYLFRYNSQRYLMEVEDAFGKKIEIVRDAANNVQSIRSHFGQEYSLTYNAGKLSSLTTPANQTYNLTYSSTGMLTRFTKPEGNSSYSQYDAFGYLTSHGDDHGSEAVITNLRRGGVTYRTREGLTSRQDVFTSNENLQMVDLYEPDGSFSRTMTYQNSSSWELKQDLTRQTEITSSDSRLSGADYLKYREKNYPNSFGRYRFYQDRTYTFGTNLAQFQRTTQGNENDLFYFFNIYDSTTRTNTTTTSKGKSQRTVYNNQEQVVETQLGTLTPVQYQYDPLGRLSRIVQGDRETQLSYDSFGFLSQVLDPMGRATSYQNDAVGRLTTEIRNDSQATQYTYDLNSNISSITPPEKLMHEIFYNLADLMSVYRGPASTPQQLSYDFDKRLTSKVRGDRRDIQYTYGAQGTVGADKITQARSADFTINYIYDILTKYLSQVQSSDGVSTMFTYGGDLIMSKSYTGPFTGSIDYTYRTEGLYLNSQSVQGQTLTYQYDSGMDVSRIGNLNILYNNSENQIREMSLGNIRQIITRNSFGEIIRKQTLNNSTQIFDEVYTRDRLGRVINRRTTTSGGGVTLYEFSYDSIGRLNTYGTNGNLIRRYQYDANGNRTGISNNVSSLSATYDDQDRLLTYGSTQYFYNDHGDLNSKLDTNTGLATTYQYTSFGQLRSVSSSGTTIDYVLDGENKRVGRRVNGAITHHWMYDPQGRLVAELNPDGSLKSRFIYMTQSHSPDYMIQNGLEYFFIKDHVGSILQVVAPNGFSTQFLRYSEFGQVTQDSNPGFQPFGFAGGLYDPTTGLVRFGARDYDPSVGRWTSKDPILFGGGDTNLYGYVASDPVNGIDPMGLYWFRQSWQEPGVVGRDSSIVEPKGKISDFIETCVPAGYTFGKNHDAFVDYAAELGVPDAIANIPSMVPAYMYSVGQETLRSVGIVSQPTP